MSIPSRSLLEAEAATDAAAPAFSFFSELQEIENEAGKAGEFTGERLRRDRPQVYDAILAAYANGLSQRQIARALRVSPNTIAAVVEREPTAIDAHKQRLISGLRRFTNATIERMIEELDRMPLQSLPVAFGVAVDKMQLLSGEATQRVERVEVRQDAVREYLDGLPVLDAEVVPATGVSGGEVSQKDLAAGGALLTRRDLQSGVLCVADSVEAATRATCHASVEPGQAEPGPVASEGGGGGAATQAVCHGVMNQAAQNFGQMDVPSATGKQPMTKEKCKK